MVKAIRVHEHGGSEVLTWEEMEIREPKEGEVLVRNKAIPVNDIDFNLHRGDYKASTMAFIPGKGGVGEVIAVGPGLSGIKVGDIVAYYGSPMGSSAEQKIHPAEWVVPVPSAIDPVTAAFVLTTGMPAHILLHHCFKVEPEHTILVHGAAVGIGSLLCQWANALGAKVIGTVSTAEQADQAREDGCHHVIVYKMEDFVARVNEITAGKGVEVVYDSVGKDTFQASLDCLKVRGTMVIFGDNPTDYTPDAAALSSLLKAKSLRLTCPDIINHYLSARDEYLEIAGELFKRIASGSLPLRLNIYPLSEAAKKAHEDLENERASGFAVLTP